MSDAVSAVKVSGGLDMYDKVSDIPLSFSKTEMLSGSRAGRGSSLILSTPFGTKACLENANSAASRHTIHGD